VTVTRWDIHFVLLLCETITPAGSSPRNPPPVATVPPTFAQ
jgi:hypothetical protein